MCDGRLQLQGETFSPVMVLDEPFGAFVEEAVEVAALYAVILFLAPVKMVLLYED